ncbi:MAG: hypothetical protein LKI28_05040 [Ancrocorticia sp.]|jgi:two-component system sensor histidine kinase DesK|nr:hypothetical protein [Ancrocorticia sp.]
MTDNCRHKNSKTSTWRQTKGNASHAIQELSRRATKDVRDTVGVLRARDLAAELAAAREVIAAAGIALTVRGTATDVAPDCRQPFAWALRETITNAARHSHARSCIVTLEPRRLVVADDGVGRGSSHPGNGLRGMTARIAERGGHVRVVDAKGEAAWASSSRNDDPERPGTRVEVTL